MEDMVWHHKDKVKDDVLRHPTDAKVWKDFDDQYPKFMGDPCNVRLALVSDGFNPFMLWLLHTVHRMYS